MSDGIIANVNPNIKAVDLGDGTFGIAVVSEQAQDRGIATGGSNTTLEDTTKNWIVNHFAGDTIEVVIAGVEYNGLIVSNTATVITMGALGGGAIVTAGDPYKIKSAAGAEATIADGADVTQGAIADAVVVAGAAGTLSAKLRAISRDVGAFLTSILTVTRREGGISNSGVLSGNTQVKGSAGNVYWMTISDTANLAIEINDSVGGGGTDVWGIDLPAAGYAHIIFDPPLECATGIYLDVSTGTCNVTIGYI